MKPICGIFFGKSNKKKWFKKMNMKPADNWNKFRPLAKALFLPITAMLVTGFLLLNAFAYLYFKTVVSRVFYEELQTTQNLFVNNVSQDILTGAYSEAYRKCQSFVQEPIAVAVKITDVAGKNICDVSRLKIEGSHELNSTIYFDEKREQPAAKIAVQYSMEGLKAVLTQAWIFLGVILFLIVIGLLIFVRFISKKIATPIEKMSNLLAEADIETLQNSSKLVSSGGVLEIEKLKYGSEKLAVQIRSYQKELVEKTRLAAIAKTTQMLAHDVRKPFSLLKIGLDVLRAVESKEEMSKVLKELTPQVEKAVTSVNGLIQDVMEMGSEAALITEPISPDSLIEASLSEVFRIREKADVSVNYDLQHRHMVDVDGIKVLRVFSNIIDNGVQAMELKGGLWVKTREIKEEEKQFTEFCLGNSGSYIPPEEISNLFEAFFTKGKKGGTGLGLAIAKKIVTSHRGRIWCKSSKEVGTEFYFTLPVAVKALNQTTAKLPSHSKQVHEARTALSINKLPEASQGSGIKSEEAYEREIVEALHGSKQKLNILLIDDEPLYLKALETELSKSSLLRSLLTVTSAKSSDDALMSLKETNFSVIICDIDIGPDSLDGYEVVKKMRSLGVTATICIHSNRNLPSDFKTAIEVGADSFMPKPMTRTHLLKIIAGSLINRSEKQSTLPLLEVAVIDDNVFIQGAWEKALKQDVKVQLFDGPTAFLEKLKSDNGLLTKLSCIVTDYNFDDDEPLNGATFTLKLKQLGFHCPIILSTDGEVDKDEASLFDGIAKKESLTWEKLKALINSDLNNK